MSRSVAADQKRRNLEAFGLKIKRFRRGAALSAGDLAAALGVTLSTVRNWECGLSRPDPEAFPALFSALRVSPNDFFGAAESGPALSAREREMVDRFRAMDSRGQEDYLAIGEAMASRCRLLRLREARRRIVRVPDRGRYAAAGAGDGWGDPGDPEDVLLYGVGPAARADEIFTVSGRSMEPNFHDGDRVLVEYCAGVELGQVYIFSLRGSGCVIKEAAADRLHSRNKAFEDIIPPEEEGAEVIGRVVGVLDPSMVPPEEEQALYLEALSALKGGADV